MDLVESVTNSIGSVMESIVAITNSIKSVPPSIKSESEMIVSVTNLTVSEVKMIVSEAEIFVSMTKTIRFATEVVTSVSDTIKILPPTGAAIYGGRIYGRLVSDHRYSRPLIISSVDNLFHPHLQSTLSFVAPLGRVAQLE